MNHEFLDADAPVFYGATSIGERGQIVIPADARRDIDLTPSTKVMVFRAGPYGQGLLILKAEAVAKMLSKASQLVDGMKDIFDTSATDTKTDTTSDPDNG